uniref:Uncharacterized protein n=1 Tax=Rhizophora mucronata TaxID=61149 RepID=A0A2P2ITB5_RHIMU
MGVRLLGIWNFSDYVYKVIGTFCLLTIP